MRGSRQRESGSQKAEEGDAAVMESQVRWGVGVCGAKSGGGEECPLTFAPIVADCA